jgi:hypothetical protein
VAQTIAGVCQKYDELSCAQPNCVQRLTLAEQECSLPAENFQGLIDCVAVATISCSGNPPSPEVPDCDGDIERLSACANGDDPPIATSPPTTPTPTPTPTGLSCQDSSSCTSWTCLCDDGYSVSLAVCSNGTCEGPTYVCSASNPSAASACQAHGGVL